MNETVLITGASGKIGLQIVAGFLEKGHDVIAICSKQASKQGVEEKFSRNPKLRVMALDLTGDGAVDYTF